MIQIEINMIKVNMLMQKKIIPKLIAHQRLSALHWYEIKNIYCLIRHCF